MYFYHFQFIIFYASIRTFTLKKQVNRTEGEQKANTFAIAVNRVAFRVTLGHPISRGQSLDGLLLRRRAQQ